MKLKKTIILVITLCFCISNGCNTRKVLDTDSHEKDIISEDRGHEAKKDEEFVLTIGKEIVDQLYEGVKQKDIDASLKKNGYKSGVLNDDGSITYVMTVSQHEELIENTKNHIEKTLMERFIDSDSFPGIVDIKHNDDFTSFSIYVSTENVKVSESMSVITLYVMGKMYKAMEGKEIDNIHVDFINKSSGEIIESADSKNVGKS